MIPPVQWLAALYRVQGGQLDRLDRKGKLALLHDVNVLHADCVDGSHRRDLRRLMCRIVRSLQPWGGSVRVPRSMRR